MIYTIRTKLIIVIHTFLGIIIIGIIAAIAFSLLTA